MEILGIRWKKTSFGWKLQFMDGERKWKDVPAVNEAEDPAETVPVVTKVISF
jgi:hypothetical protein